MDPVISQALLVMLVGMITVFVVLLLVVVTGRTLIKLVNQYFPGENKRKTSSDKTIPVFYDEDKISKGKMVAIIAAVEAVTNGKGKIQSIEKV